MSLWLHAKRREHPRGFLPGVEKALGLVPLRKTAVRRARAAAAKGRRRAR